MPFSAAGRRGGGSKRPSLGGVGWSIGGLGGLSRFGLVQAAGVARLLGRRGFGGEGRLCDLQCPWLGSLSVIQPIFLPNDRRRSEHCNHPYVRTRQTWKRRSSDLNSMRVQAAMLSPGESTQCAPGPQFPWPLDEARFCARACLPVVCSGINSTILKSLTRGTKERLGWLG